MKCIESWKKYCPDYEIIEWNEDNFDINQNKYCKKFYDKKLWAFASDYARFFVLYNHWWVYVDTDIELLKPIDELLDNKFFTSFQDVFLIWASIIGSEKNNQIVQDILNIYDTKITRIILPNLVTKIFKKYWIDKYSNQVIKNNDFTIYTKDYFYPYAYFEKEIKITKNTYAIHHYDASWLPKIIRIIFFPIIRLFAKIKSM